VVEAEAAGTPVIAFAQGGAADCVVAADDTNWQEATGVLFPEQSVESVVQAVRRFLAWEHRFDPAVLQAHAARFSRPRFVRALRRHARAVWGAEPEPADERTVSSGRPGTSRSALPDGGCRSPLPGPPPT